jgi:hypothetical protein
MYDYLLGGFHNFAVDRRAAEAAIAIYPEMRLLARANRAFLGRAVTFLLDQGIDQFLDIGSGIPTVRNVHEVAQERHPTARVVYVDSDPVAVRHSTLLLQDQPNAAVIQADARQPAQILQHPTVQQLLDFTKPLGVLLVALLHFIVDDAAAAGLVRELRAAMPAGSYLVLSHGTPPELPPGSAAEMRAVYARSTNPARARSHAEIAAFFGGLELVDPGLVYVPLWRPDSPHEPLRDAPARTAFLAGVGRKP